MSSGLSNSPLVLGYGLLGKEIVRQTGWEYQSRSTGFDINNIRGTLTAKHKNIIINCIANTDSYSDNREDHWDVNYRFVSDLVDYCNCYGKKLIHISTDFVYINSKDRTEKSVPVHDANWYSYTKLLADGYVQLKSDNFLLIRESHKPTPFPYPKAWIDVKTSADYVDVISEKIIRLIESGATGIWNVGTEEKSIFELAVRTNPDVEPIGSPSHVPKETALDLSKIDAYLGK